VPNTLFGKLAAALAILLCISSVVYVMLTVITTRLHIQEIEQSLHRSLAANVVASESLIREGEANPKALDRVFRRLMEINAAIEVYLLDREGQILSYSAPPNKVKRAHVSLDPVRTFLAGDERLPIHGDDPRDPFGRKIFSAAPVLDQGRLQGYLYVVLGGETYDTVAEMFEGSYILRLTLGTVVASLLLIGTAGAVSFGWLTRRLRRLATLMDNLRRSNFQQPVHVPEQWFKASGDEIDRLGRTFDAMARHLAELLTELQHADSSRRELVANVSHDLRTPLASLHGALETVLMKGSQLSEAEKRHYLQLALKHSQYLERLTAQLFELATLESGDRKLHAEVFSVAELVQDVAQRFKPEADRRKLGLECNAPPDTPYIAADIGLIERVLENLIENAIKHTPEGGAIRLSAIPREGFVSVQVADTGCGIAAADLPKIFDRTYRAAMDRDGEPGGSGLGLAIAQEILRLHGSSLAVESTVDAGTTFNFGLPTAVELAQSGECVRP
jgi:signal transduction histidine kinase